MQFFTLCVIVRKILRIFENTGPVLTKILRIFARITLKSRKNSKVRIFLFLE